MEKSGFDHTRQTMLSANTDGLNVWADSVIPAGVLWVPEQADVGTIGVRITKIHSVSDTVEESQLDDPVQPLDSIPFVELEVSYAPGIRLHSSFASRSASSIHGITQFVSLCDR